MSNKTIKPIQTHYKGYHFRSRLEARWAVFFDALGLKWEYEPEGFVLPSGRQYLPDFRISGVDTNYDPYVFWIEVKGSAEKMSTIEKEKIKEFQKAIRSGTEDLILVDGLPEKRLYSGGSFNYLLWSYRKRPWYCYEETYELEASYVLEDWYHRGGDCRPVDDLIHACNAAKSARFEFGQKGVEV